MCTKYTITCPHCSKSFDFWVNCPSHSGSAFYCRGRRPYGGPPDGGVSKTEGGRDGGKVVKCSECGEMIWFWETKSDTGGANA